MAKKTMSCPICGKSIEWTYYEEDIGIVEYYCDCPNCGYYSRMSYSPVEEGISFVNDDFDYISAIKEAWNRRSDNGKCLHQPGCGTRLFQRLD